MLRDDLPWQCFLEPTSARTADQLRNGTTVRCHERVEDKKPTLTQTRIQATRGRDLVSSQKPKLARR